MSEDVYDAADVSEDTDTDTVEDTDTDTDAAATVEAAPPAPAPGAPPRATIVGAPRHTEGMVLLYAPDGTPTEVARDNVRDFINHLGYRQGVNKKKEVEVVEDEDAPALKAMPPPPPEVKSATHVEIEALRAQARGMGLTVDNRLGLNKLREMVGKGVPKK